MGNKKKVHYVLCCDITSWKEWAKLDQETHVKFPETTIVRVNEYEIPVCLTDGYQTKLPTLQVKHFYNIRCHDVSFVSSLKKLADFFKCVGRKRFKNRCVFWSNNNVGVGGVNKRWFFSYCCTKQC